MKSPTYPRKVPGALSPGGIVLDAVQHQVEREDGHTEDGPTANGHLLLQFHPPLLIWRMLMSRSRGAKEENVNMHKWGLMKVPKVKKCSVAGKNSASRVCQRCLKSTSALQILEQGLVGEGRDMGGGVYTRGTPISGSRVAVCQLRPNHSQFQPPSKCPLSSTIQTEERQGEKSNTGSKQWEPRQGSSVPPAKPVYVCVCVCAYRCRYGEDMSPALYQTASDRGGCNRGSISSSWAVFILLLGNVLSCSTLKEKSQNEMQTNVRPLMKSIQWCSATILVKIALTKSYIRARLAAVVCYTVFSRTPLAPLSFHFFREIKTI